MRSALCFVSGFIAATTFASLSFAQSLEEKCLANVKDICGDSDANICFATETNWDYTLPECEGDIQTLIEMANEANAEDPGNAGGSYGGKVRSGTGMEFSQVASLSKGDLVTLVENAGSVMNGYPWFKISYTDGKTGALRVGYQWGGLLCSFGGPSGVYQICPANWDGS